MWTGDGFITFDEVEFAMDGEHDETKVQIYLRSVQCPVLNALASGDPKKTRRAFDKMDVASRCALFRLPRENTHLLETLSYSFSGDLFCPYFSKPT